MLSISSSEKNEERRGPWLLGYISGTDFVIIFVEINLLICSKSAHGRSNFSPSFPNCGLTKTGSCYAGGANRTTHALPSIGKSLGPRLYLADKHKHFSSGPTRQPGNQVYFIQWLLRGMGIVATLLVISTVFLGDEAER